MTEILSDIFLMIILMLVLTMSVYIVILIVAPWKIKESDYFSDIKLYFDRIKYKIERRKRK